MTALCLLCGLPFETSRKDRTSCAWCRSNRTAGIVALDAWIAACPTIAARLDRMRVKQIKIPTPQDRRGGA